MQVENVSLEEDTVAGSKIIITTPMAATKIKGGKKK